MSNIHIKKHPLHRKNLNKKILGLFLSLNTFHIQAMEDPVMTLEDVKRDWSDYFDKPEDQLLKAIKAGEFPASITKLLKMNIHEAYSSNKEAQAKKEEEKKTYKDLLRAIINQWKNFSYIKKDYRNITSEIEFNFLIKTFEEMSKCIIMNYGPYRSEFFMMLAANVAEIAINSERCTTDQKFEVVKCVIQKYSELLVIISENIHCIMNRIARREIAGLKWPGCVYQNYFERSKQYIYEYQSLLLYDSNNNLLSILIIMRPHKKSFLDVTKTTVFQLIYRLCQEISERIINHMHNYNYLISVRKEISEWITYYYMRYSNNSLANYIDILKQFLYKYTKEAINFADTEQHLHKFISLVNIQYAEALDKIIQRIKYLQINKEEVDVQCAQIIQRIKMGDREAIQDLQRQQQKSSNAEQEIQEYISECEKLFVDIYNKERFEYGYGFLNILTFVHKNNKLNQEIPLQLIHELLTNLKIKLETGLGKKTFYLIMGCLIREYVETFECDGEHICYLTQKIARAQKDMNKPAEEQKKDMTELQNCIERSIESYSYLPKYDYIYWILSFNAQNMPWKHATFEKVSEAIITNMKDTENLILHSRIFSDFCKKFMDTAIGRKATYDQLLFLISGYLKGLEVLSTKKEAKQCTEAYQLLRNNLYSLWNETKNMIRLDRKLEERLSEEIANTIKKIEGSQTETFKSEQEGEINSMEQESKKNTSDTEQNIKKI